MLDDLISDTALILIEFGVLSVANLEDDLVSSSKGLSLPNYILSYSASDSCPGVFGTDACLGTRGES